MSVTRQPLLIEHTPRPKPTIIETPDQYAMGPKPPPVTFDMIEDLGRVCASIRSMAELGGSKADEQTLRRLGRLMLIERELRQIVHGDVLHKRMRGDPAKDESVLFPIYRTFPNMRDGGEISLIVQDLQAVWDGEKWVGDGACTFNKWAQGTSKNRLDGKDALCHDWSAPWPKCALFLHSSMSEYLIGERVVSGRQFLPSMQWMRFIDLKPGDYVTGELYVEIC